MKEKITARSRIFIILIMIPVMLLTGLTQMSAYAADEPFYLTVGQVFTASSSSETGIFRYKLKSLGAGKPIWSTAVNPMPGGSGDAEYTFEINGNRSVNVGPFNFVQPGIYQYEISQVIGERKTDYTYDERVFLIEIYVDTKLNVVYFIYNEEYKKAEKIEFRNSYRAPDQPVITPEPSPSPPVPPVERRPVLMVDPPVKKTVFGNPPQDSTFQFMLRAHDVSNPMPKGSANGMKFIEVVGSGEGEFGTWDYERPGVYYYSVYEVNTYEEGYTYDTEMYTITDTVSMVDGEFVLNRIVTNHLNKPVTSMGFLNTYTPEESKPGENENPQGGNGHTQGGDGPIQGGNNPIVDDDDGRNLWDGGPGLGGMWGNNGGGYGGGSQGSYGPKTGDDRNTTLHEILFAAGVILMIGSMVYIASKKRETKKN